MPDRLASRADLSYLPMSQNPTMGMTLLFASADSSESPAQLLRGLVRSLESDQPVFALRTMEENFRERRPRS